MVTSLTGEVQFAEQETSVTNTGFIVHLTRTGNMLRHVHSRAALPVSECVAVYLLSKPHHL